LSEISDLILKHVEMRRRGPKCPVDTLLATLTDVQAKELNDWLGGDAEATSISAGLHEIYKKKSEANDTSAVRWKISADSIRRHRRPVGPPEGCACIKTVQ
jgi:hypothetical protein